MGTLILCIVAFAILVYFMRKAAAPDSAKPTLNLLNREGDSDEDTWNTYVAGAKHHIGPADVGGFFGWVANDAGNSHDSDAMGIYNANGRLLGYIPASELGGYRSWCDAQPVPCAGYIYVEDNQMRGRVKAVLPCCEEFIEEEFDAYAKWVRRRIGAKYAPNINSLTFEYN